MQLVAASVRKLGLRNALPWHQEQRLMPTQYKRSWLLLTSIVACAGFAAMPVFAVEPANVEKNADVLSPGDTVQSMYLIKLLESSSQFRVRAQAAISLGVIEESLAARNALMAALRDAHPAVRAAAATSLGRIGDANHVSALRLILAGDPEEPVRNAARASIARLETAIETPIVLQAAANTATLTATRL
jgi:hypothetical protein